MSFYDSIASGAASALGFIGAERANRQNKDIWRKTQDWDTQQAQINRDYQERMSNTSWQRGVADMKAAGINPMVAFSQGGASSPSGSVIGGKTSAPMRDSVSTAIQAGLAMAQINNLNASAAKSTVDAANSAADTPFKTAIGDAVASGVSSAKAALGPLSRTIGGWMYNADRLINNASAMSIRLKGEKDFSHMSFKDLKRNGYVK